ncbi:MAG: hypothetical protein ACI4OY_09030 [Aristaeellaceae bacterium]
MWRPRCCGRAAPACSSAAWTGIFAWGAEISKPVPGRPLENGGIHYTGAWQGIRVAMDDGLQQHDAPHGSRDMLFFYALDANNLLLDVSCMPVEQADNGSYATYPLAL